MRAKSLKSWFEDEHRGLYKQFNAGMLASHEYFTQNAALKARYEDLREHGCKLAPES
jgi:hypothetical protein